jgi:hypothetical protein
MTAIEVQERLGQAAFARWSELPRDVQELLFEAADPRTAHPPKPTQLA